LQGGLDRTRVRTRYEPMVVIHGFRRGARMNRDQFWLTDEQFSKIEPHLPADTRAARFPTGPGDARLNRTKRSVGCDAAAALSEHASKRYRP
jgi:hypothetical protein